MALEKRKCETVIQGEEGADQEDYQPSSSKRRRIEFQDVTVYNFKRRQGYVCVPSQGGNTLGMEDNHYGVEVLTIDEHAAERRKESREAMMGDGSEGPGTSFSSEPTSQDDEEDFSSILIPVDSKERRVVLRRSGVPDIDVKEKEECRELRTSRQACGCTCQLYCLPDSCACAREGIKCQVDRPGFPCSCTAEGCLNKTGRLEFNPVKVRTHFVRTIMRTRLEEARYLPHTSNHYLPSGLGYLAQVYSHQDGQAQPGYGAEGQWVGSWGLQDHPWWAFTAQHSSGGEEVGAPCEESQEESIIDTESSDSEEEIISEIVEEETCISEVVTDETRVISKSEEDTLEILNEVLNKVNEQSSTSNVTTDDEGISSDNSFCEETRLQTDIGKSEEDFSERSEGFDDEISEDICQQYCQIEFDDTETETNKSPTAHFESTSSSSGFVTENSTSLNGSDTEESVDAPSSGLFEEFTNNESDSQIVGIVDSGSSKGIIASKDVARECPKKIPEVNNIVATPLVETVPA